MYGVPYMAVQSPSETTVVVRGLSPTEIRRSAVRQCCRVLGDEGCWQFTHAEVRPCMVSVGGRVRLYEGTFAACRAQ